MSDHAGPNGSSRAQEAPLSGGATSPLSVRGLVVAYRSEPVLWDVTWSARPGTMSAIVGPNGAGKTSLLNAAIGLIPKTRGEALFWGKPFHEVRQRVAYVPQRESVDWDFPITVREVVQMGATRGGAWLVPAWLSRWTRAFARTVLPRTSPRGEDSCKAALVRLGMQEFAERPIGELSGGQQQRVFLARALSQNADLYLLDEPFAGVDVATEELLTAELRRLTEGGKTIVAVHHDLEDVASRFDDVVILNRTVVASGPARETLTPQAIARAYADRPSPEALFSTPVVSTPS